MDRLDDGGLCAYDYTGVVRHKGKLYVVGDLSLSFIGGLSLPSAGFALILTGPVVAPLLLASFSGWLPSYLAVVALLLLIAAYVLFEVGPSDRDKPAHRVKLALAGMWRQPDHVVNNRKDTVADDIRLVAIVKRPQDPSRCTAGTPVQLRVQYRPTPRRSDEFAVADDRLDTLQEWGSLVASAARLNGVR